MQTDPVNSFLECTGHALVVDDDSANRMLMRRILERHGHAVTEAPDGAEALRLIEQCPPDIVLLDINMPRMGGIEMCRRMKTDPLTVSIPVLLVTGTSDLECHIEGIQAGANDLLFKPVAAEHVVLRVRNALYMKFLFDRAREDLERVRELEYLRSCLTHAIAGDIQSLLRVTSGYLELLRAEAAGVLDEQQCGYLDSCLNLTEAFARRTGLLHDISRLEQARMPLTREPCDLRRLVEDATELAVPPARRQDVLVVADASSPAMVRCDATMIQRVTQNLVDNAVKFSGGGTPVRVRISRVGEGARVTVSDRGVGIPRLRQASIFRLFGGQNALRKHASLTGLGLAFCKLAVEAHGGRIGVESEPETGSTFWYEIDQ